jgi:two-component system, chemotaxis family, CheB/CheR fusion protein
LSRTPRSKSPKSPAVNRDQPAPPDKPAGLAFPIVGIGASAGGLKALEGFFSGFAGQHNPGMAFVVVQHLAPDHTSILSEIIGRYTTMPVFEIKDGVGVEPDCVYIIPPNHDLALMGGTLHLLEPTVPRGQRLPIDFFFRTLAHDQRDSAIAIVLSGTGSDATMGIQAIKGEGGTVFAQKPDTAEFGGMPASAIATGFVDHILAPPDMANRLVAYSATIFAKRQIAPVPHRKANNELKKVFIVLRAQTGHDFSQYKSSTIHRRIERRMAVHQIESLEEYTKLLQQTPSEVQSLFP